MIYSVEDHDRLVVDVPREFSSVNFTVDILARSPTGSSIDCITRKHIVSDGRQTLVNN